MEGGGCVGGESMVSGCRVSMGPLNKNEDKEKVWGGERKERNAIVSSSVLSVFMGLLSLSNSLSDFL